MVLTGVTIKIAANTQKLNLKFETYYAPAWQIAPFLTAPSVALPESKHRSGSGSKYPEAIRRPGHKGYTATTNPLQGRRNAQRNIPDLKIWEYQITPQNIMVRAWVSVIQYSCMVKPAN